MQTDEQCGTLAVYVWEQLEKEAHSYTHGDIVTRCSLESLFLSQIVFLYIKKWIAGKPVLFYECIELELYFLWFWKNVIGIWKQKSCIFLLLCGWLFKKNFFF